MPEKTATVEVLTAEVKALMVGSRQVTLSVFRQLDEVDFDQIEPFGRVRDRNSENQYDIIGRRKDSGDLVRASLEPLHCAQSSLRRRLLKKQYLSWEDQKIAEQHQMEYESDLPRWDAQSAIYKSLPLIVLAGLK